MFAYIRNNFVHTVSAVSDMQWRDGEIVECPEHIDYGWRYENGEWIEPTPPTPPPHSRTLTKLAFLNRFTDAEAIAIDLASQGATPQAAAMRRYQKKVDLATFIDLDRSDTRAGVEALEAGGLLGEGRAAEILDAVVGDVERWNGL